MSNNGPRFQARYEGEMNFATVRDSTNLCTSPFIHRRGEHYVVCSCEDVETAKIIATALNRQAMQMAQDQGNGDGY